MSFANMDLILDGAPEGSVIAGGAVSSTLLGLPVKDYDVFIGANTDFKKDSLFSISLRRAKDELNTNGRDPEGAYSKSDIVDNVKFELQGLPIDVVIVRNVLRHVPSSFPFGLSQCWYDGELHTTEVFDMDLEENTLTFTQNKALCINDVKYAFRMGIKFPTRTLVHVNEYRDSQKSYRGYASTSGFEVTRSAFRHHFHDGVFGEAAPLVPQNVPLDAPVLQETAPGAGLTWDVAPQIFRDTAPTPVTAEEDTPF